MRLPWLDVKVPKFEFSDLDIDEVKAKFISLPELKHVASSKKMELISFTSKSIQPADSKKMSIHLSDRSARDILNEIAKNGPNKIWVVTKINEGEKLIFVNF